MQKFISITVAGIFVFSLLAVPVSGIASEEIQLAAAIGSKEGAKTTTEGTASSGGAIGSGGGAAAAASEGMSVGTMAVIGVGVAGVVMAAQKTESTSNH